jgi:hypothetical protein
MKQILKKIRVLRKTNSFKQTLRSSVILSARYISAFRILIILTSINVSRTLLHVVT